MNTMWGGRFDSPTAHSVARFTSSISFDQRLAEYDIAVSLAHVAMLGKTGILTAEEAGTIQDGLHTIREDLISGQFEWQTTLEDVHMNIEHALTQRIGPIAGKLHTARSRNDQTVTDLRLYAKHACHRLAEQLHHLRSVLVAEADKHMASDQGHPTIMPGYTHLQVAQPILLSHWFLAYADMLERDEARFGDAYQRMDECPLGAGALAGTTWPIDRSFTAQVLGFARPSRNSLDAVASRDFVLECLAACSITMVHLSRLSEELILFGSFEFGFLAYPDGFTTGSSMMPQKKNPDVSELTRGKTGRVFGHLMGLLTTLKALPLAYNKDLQEDKEALFDSVDTLSAILDLHCAMLPQLTWKPDITRRAATRGFSTATDLADYLTSQGLPFRDAHRLTGRLVAHCFANGKELWELSKAEWQAFAPGVSAPSPAALTIEASVTRRQSAGGTAPERVAEAIASSRERHANSTSPTTLNT